MHPYLQVFTYQTDKFDGSVAFAVVETTDDEVILQRASDILIGMISISIPYPYSYPHPY